MTRLARAFEAGVTRTVHASVRHRRKILVATWLAALLAAPGIFQLEVHNKMTEWVNPEDPAPAAFLDGVEHLDGLVNFERTMLWYEGDDPDGILSPESLYEQEALLDFVSDAVPEVTGGYGPVRFVQLAAYEMQLAQGQSPTEARLPSDPTQLALAIQVTQQTQGQMLRHTMAANQTVSYLGINFEAEPFSPDASRVGGLIAQAIADAHASLNFSTLGSDQTEPVGIASVTSQVDGLLRQDLFWLGGAGVLFVFVLFWVAAGRPIAVLGGFSSLGIGLVVSVGLLGWLGIPFNILNMAIIPLVMGNGIDYSIHVLAEANMDERDFDDGLGRHLGKALGVPIVLVTLTTCVGLLSLGTSASPYLRQMGFIASGSIALIALLSLTYLPAFLATFKGQTRAPRPATDGLFARVGHWGKKHPGAVAILVVALTAGGAVGFATMDYEVDLLSGSFPPDHPAIVNQEVFGQYFDTEDVWFLLMDGPVVSDASFAFQQRWMDEVTARALVVDSDSFFDLPRFVEGHHQQRAVPAGGLLLPLLPAEATPPATAQQKVAAVEGEGVYANIIRPMLSTDHTTGALYVFPFPDGLAVAGADATRSALEEAVAAAGAPADMDVQVYSFKLLARDFMGESQSSLQVLYVLSLSSTVALFWGVTGSWRATLVVALPVLLSSLWWFGLLKASLGAIGVYQLISLVFITSIGSDYAAYLVYKYRESRQWNDTMRTTGRAVLFSAATDAGAFLIFSLTAVRSGGQMMLGAAFAIIAIFVATALVVPPLLRRDGDAQVS